MILDILTIVFTFAFVGFVLTKTLPGRGVKQITADELRPHTFSLIEHFWLVAVVPNS